MEKPKNIFYLFFSIVAIFAVPYIGGYIQQGGHFEEGYFEFPVLSPKEKAPYNATVFYIFTVIVAVLLGIIAFPRLFGFKKVTPPPKPPVDKVPFPKWFWIGLVMWGVPFTFNTLHVDFPKFLLNWGAIPLFWGFTLILDGLVYVRTGGKSLIAKFPQALIGIGTAAITGWMMFEYLNFFVNDNWYYPHGNLIPDEEFELYAIIGSTGLVPPIFEWYYLLNTFGNFKYRYVSGPKIAFSPLLQNIILLTAFAGMFLAPFYPNTLFGILWYAPLVIVAITLEKLGIWTPFTPIKKGDWSFLVLTSLTYLLHGFCLECWNYLSAAHLSDGTTISYSPNFWQYSIPYVNVYHIFEMPILGYGGYLPFGVYCVVWWIACATLLNIPNNFEKDGY